MGWSFRIEICAGQHKIPIGVTGIGDPHFLSIQNVMVALLFGLGFDSGDIGSRSGFSHTVSLFRTRKTGFYHFKINIHFNTYTNEWFFNHTAQVLLFLLLVTRQNHWNLL
jgi:hypothetical protein